MPSDIQHTPELVLTARIEEKTPDHAVIGVFQNGGKAGVLVVDAEQAEQLVGILNAGTDLLAACEETEAYFTDQFGPGLEGEMRTEAPLENLRAAIAKAKPEPRKDDTDARTITTHE